MKQLMQLCLILFCSSALHAQNTNLSAANRFVTLEEGIPNKITADGDTLPIFNFNPAGPFDMCSYGSIADSGYCFGTNIFNHKSFAERFDISGGDSSVRLVAVAVLFHGKYDISSTHSIDLNVWDKKSRHAVSGRNNLFYSNMPRNIIASKNYPLDSLYIPTGQPGQGTISLLSISSGYIQDTFYVGYSMNYSFNSLIGDTLGLTSTFLGTRNNAVYNISGNDTIINVQNAVQYSDGSWHDIAFEENKLINLSIAPVVIVKWTTGVHHINKNNIKFYGHYPNPGRNNINIKVGLKSKSDISIDVFDMTGRLIKAIDHKSLDIGDHIFTIQVDNFPAGDYLYIIKGSEGTMFSSKFSKTD